MAQEKTDLLQGTPDGSILKTLQFAPEHGFEISLGIRATGTTTPPLS